MKYDDLKNCTLCEHRCEVNRLVGETGVCRMTLPQVAAADLAAECALQLDFTSARLMGADRIFFPVENPPSCGERASHRKNCVARFKSHVIFFHNLMNGRAPIPQNQLLLRIKVIL